MAFNQHHTPYRTGIIALMLSALMLTGCSSAPEKTESGMPDWVNSLPERSGYVYGVGSADNTGSEANAAESARERARADLIRQMQVTVSSEFTRETRLKMAGEETTEFVEQVNDKVRSRIPQVELPGLSWTERWVNPATGTHYALAELNRRAAEARLAEQLTTLDLELEEKRLPPAETPEGEPVSRIDQVREAMPVLSLFAKRDKLVRQLTFVAESGFSRFQPDEELQIFREALNRVLSDLTLTIHPTGRSDDRVFYALSQQLTQQGFSVVTRQQSADLFLYYDLSLTGTVQQNQHYVFVFANVIVRDNQGKIIQSYQQEARGVSGVKKRAEYLAIKSLADAFQKRLVAGLLQ